MKTEAAKEFDEYISYEIKRMEDSAKYAAIHYTENDDPASKADYNRLTFTVNILKDVRVKAFRALHAVESLIPEAKDE